MTESGDYISREDLLERIDGIWDCNDMVFRPNDHCCSVPEDCKGCKWAETRDAIRRIVENFPAADVRPVVLCRDCTFFKPQQKSKRWSSTIPMCSRSATIKMPPDGFCSFGEKREES